MLVPPDLVHTVVVAAAGTVGGLVEVAVEEDCGGALLTSGGATIDTHSVCVHIRILLGCCLDPGDAVGEAGVLQVLVAHLLEFLAAVAGAHGVELDHDEAQFGQRGGVPVVGLEGLGRIAVAGTGIDVLDNWVLLRGVEVCGTLDDAPHLRDAVATGSHEDLRSHPAGGFQLGNVGGGEDLRGEGFPG